MGIYIGMRVAPHRLSADGWDGACQEAVQLAEKIGLNADVLTNSVDDFVKKKDETLLGGPEGLCIRGDRDGGRVEPVSIQSNLNFYLEQKLTDSGTDILLSAATDQMMQAGFTDDDLVTVFWSKTLTRKVHIRLLAIACLFADRFPYAVTIGGDITRVQCREAVQLANSFLDNRIQMPVSCCAGTLLERLAASGISEERQLCAFICLYLGELQEYIHGCLTERFSSELLAQCLEKFKFPVEYVFEHIEIPTKRAPNQKRPKDFTD